MKAYKVVETDVNGRKYSWAARGRAEVEYKVDEWAEAPEFMADRGYGLCVFDDLEVAADRTCACDELWECEVEEEIPLPRFLWLELLSSYGELQPSNRDFWPESTRMFKRVRLVKQLDPHLILNGAE